jgi:hypothetical protein
MAAARATVAAGPGDHLWSLAEQDLAGVLGRIPTEAEVQPHWMQVVDINRNKLVDPDNPDLIFAGQVFDMPR